MSLRSFIFHDNFRSINPDSRWVLQMIHTALIFFTQCKKENFEYIDDFGCAQIIYKLLPDKAWKMNHLS